MEEIRIKVLDAVHCQVMEGKSLITPCLTIQATFWKQGPYHKEAKTYNKVFMTGKLFFTGLLPRVEDYCRRQNITCKVSGREGITNLPVSDQPSLPGVTFRPDQIQLMEQALQGGRGIIKSPTGSGKTVIAAGIMSCYPKAKILFLCHTIDLINQTYAELNRYGIGSLGRIGGGHGHDMTPRVIVSTMQSFVKLPPERYCDIFDIVMVDEAHHLTSLGDTKKTETGKKFVESTYAKILSKLLAPIRLGFTATLPTAEESLLSMEALLGPVIGELTLKEGMDLGLLARPHIKIIRVPLNQNVRALRNYQDVYREGVVQNRARNRLVAKEAYERAEKDQTALITVTVIEHGLNIQEMAQKIYGIDIPFIQGSTQGDIREEIKAAFKNRSIKLVIATVTGGGVWREGINIPSLNCIINAAGGKGELGLLQLLGRGMRTTDEKTEMIVIDFLDISHHHLISHFGERLWVYSENEWI